MESFVTVRTASDWDARQASFCNMFFQVVKCKNYYLEHKHAEWVLKKSLKQ